MAGAVALGQRLAALAVQCKPGLMYAKPCSPLEQVCVLVPLLVRRDSHHVCLSLMTFSMTPQSGIAGQLQPLRVTQQLDRAGSNSDSAPARSARVQGAAVGEARHEGPQAGELMGISCHADR